MWNLEGLSISLYTAQTLDRVPTRGLCVPCIQSNHITYKLTLVHLHKVTLTDPARLLCRAEAGVMTVFLTLHPEIAVASTQWVREQSTDARRDAARQTHPILCTERIAPLPRHDSLVSRGRGLGLVLFAAIAVSTHSHERDNRQQQKRTRNNGGYVERVRSVAG